MFPAAAVRVLLPVSVSVIYVIYRYLRSGRQTESSPNTGDNDDVPPQNSGNNDVVPFPELSDRDRTILEEILKDNHVLLDKIRALEPAFLDGLRKIKPAVLREMVCDSVQLDPVIVDAICKLSLKGGKEEGEENENGNVNETKSEERDEERSRSCHYPVRPTGTCKFGPNCKLNHPRITTKNNQVSKNKMKEREGLAEKPGKTECKVSKNKMKEGEGLAEKPGKTECKNYFRSGGCKPGNAFSFNPKRGEPSVAPVQELNFMDLPIRPGEKECPDYMKNGSYKSETNCTFNHPDPTATGETGPPSGYIDDGPASVQGASSSTAWDSLCVQIIPPSQGIPSQNTEGNGSQDPEYLPERSIPAPPPYVMNKAVTETNIYEQNPQQKQVEEFPEQPGQCALSDKGLPLRPGEKICKQYSSDGICNSGPACKFDHPSLSTSLL